MGLWGKWLRDFLHYKGPILGSETPCDKQFLDSPMMSKLNFDAPVQLVWCAKYHVESQKISQTRCYSSLKSEKLQTVFSTWLTDYFTSRINWFRAD